MSARHRLQELLDHPRIWRAAGDGAAVPHTLATGYQPLDHALAGGWPVRGLCEILVRDWGSGELALLMPALARLQQRRDDSGEAWLAWLNPPYTPYAPALHAAGLDVSRVLVSHCQRSPDLLWAMEQALRCGACAAVMAWCRDADHRRLRRLQLAAEAGNCWGVLFRPAYCRRQASPALLRLAVASLAGGELAVEIVKYRGHTPRRLTVDPACP